MQGDLETDGSHALEVAERSAMQAEARTFSELATQSVISILAIAVAALFAMREYRRERATAVTWTRFLSIASHDLKTPLSSLNLRIQLLERLLGPCKTRAEARADRRQLAWQTATRGRLPRAVCRR